MDGSSDRVPTSDDFRSLLREALSECGVRGDNLRRLSESAKLTPTMVVKEWESVKTDLTVDPKTRVGCLVYRLADHAGIILPRNGKVARLKQLTKVLAAGQAHG